MNEYLSVNERDDVANSLEFCADIALQLGAQPERWKWCLIGMQNALHGALVCTLSGSAGLGALSEQSQKAWLAWYEKSVEGVSGTLPKEFMADLEALYKRAKKPEYMVEFGGEPIRTSNDVDSDIKLLNELRRDFAHLTPKGWSIQLLGLPRVILSTLSVIEQLFQHPANTYRTDISDSAKNKKSIAALREQMRILERQYNSAKP